MLNSNPPFGTPRPVDVYVGQRLRQRRTLLGLTQGKIAQAVGLTFQQIQKYERGANRIGASRLYQFAGALNVPVAYFFEDMPAAIAATHGNYAATTQDNAVDNAVKENRESDPIARRETLELVRTYYKINEPTVRRRAFALIKAIADIETAVWTGD